MITTYRIQLDSERDWTFGNGLDDISNYVEEISFQHGSDQPYRSIAPAAKMQLKLHNFDGDLDIYNSTALYYDKFRIGTLIRVMARDTSGFVQMAVMKIVDVTPKIEELDKKLYIQCSDIIGKFLDSEYIAPLQTNVRVDEGLAALHATDKAIYPYESYYAFIEFNTVEDGTGPFDGSEFTDFEEAETTLLYVGDNLGKDSKIRVSNYVRDCVEAEVNGFYFFDCRNEVFKFFASYHASEQSSVWTLVDNFTAEYCKPTKYMVNEYTVNYFPRQIGDANSTLYESDSVPFALQAKSSREFTLRYSDPNNQNASVGALEILDPVMGVDIIANSRADGSGTDRTSFIVPSLKKGAASSVLTLFNRRGGNPVYITTLKLKGTPIEIYNKEALTETNIESVYRHERIPDYKNLYGVSDQDTAQAYARFMVDTFGEPSEMLERITVVATADNLSNVINRSIGEVITCIDNLKGHEDDYMIVGEQHRINPKTGQHAVTYTLRSVGRGKLFTLGTSYYDEGDVLGL